MISRSDINRICASRDDDIVILTLRKYTFAWASAVAEYRRQIEAVTTSKGSLFCVMVPNSRDMIVSGSAMAWQCILPHLAVWGHVSAVPGSLEIEPKSEILVEAAETSLEGRWLSPHQDRVVPSDELVGTVILQWISGGPDFAQITETARADRIQAARLAWDSVKQGTLDRVRTVNGLEVNDLSGGIAILTGPPDALAEAVCIARENPDVAVLENRMLSVAPESLANSCESGSPAIAAQPVDSQLDPAKNPAEDTWCSRTIGHKIDEAIAHGMSPQELLQTPYFQAHLTPDGKEPRGAMVATYRDYWSGEHRAYQNMVVSSDTGASIAQMTAIRKLFKAADISDGDEFELVVTKTGKRPFGDRKVRLIGEGVYKLEPEPGEVL